MLSTAAWRLSGNSGFRGALTQESHDERQGGPERGPGYRRVLKSTETKDTGK